MKIFTVKASVCRYCDILYTRYCRQFRTVCVSVCMSCRYHVPVIYTYKICHLKAKNVTEFVVTEREAAMKTKGERNDAALNFSGVCP